jgi:VWFA-related protein
LIWISGGLPIQLGLHNNVDSIPQGNATGRPAGRGGRSGGGSSSNSASNSTPRSSGPNLATTELPGTGLSFESDVARAIRALNEADVAVYPVDARGVSVAAAYQADRSSIGKRSKPATAFSGPDYNYETLETLAGETGGQAFHHINDLSAAIQEAAGDARLSYSLAFSPAAVWTIRITGWK